MFLKYLIILLSINSGLATYLCHNYGRVEHYLVGDGLHRKLEFIVMLENIYIEKILKLNDTNQQNCFVGLDLKLPPGLYSSREELSNPTKMGKLSAIPMDNNTEHSQLTNLFLIRNIPDDIVGMKLPVYARYPRDRGVNFTERERPRMFIRCPLVKPELCMETKQETFPCNGLDQKLCTWWEVDVTYFEIHHAEKPKLLADDDDMEIILTAASVLALLLHHLQPVFQFIIRQFRRPGFEERVSKKK